MENFKKRLEEELEEIIEDLKSCQTLEYDDNGLETCNGFELHICYSWDNGNLFLNLAPFDSFTPEDWEEIDSYGSDDIEFDDNWKDSEDTCDKVVIGYLDSICVSDIVDNVIEFIENEDLDLKKIDIIVE